MACQNSFACQTAGIKKAPVAGAVNFYTSLASPESRHCVIPAGKDTLFFAGKINR